MKVFLHFFFFMCLFLFFLLFALNARAANAKKIYKIVVILRCFVAVPFSNSMLCSPCFFTSSEISNEFFLDLLVISSASSSWRRLVFLFFIRTMAWLKKRKLFPALELTRVFFEFNVLQYSTTQKILLQRDHRVAMQLSNMWFFDSILCSHEQMQENF